MYSTILVQINKQDTKYPQRKTLLVCSHKCSNQWTL